MNIVIEALTKNEMQVNAVILTFFGHFWSTVSYSIQNYIIRNQIIEKTYSIGPDKTYWTLPNPP